MNKWTIDNIAKLLANKLDKAKINGTFLFFIKSDYFTITFDSEEVFYIEKNRSNNFYIVIGVWREHTTRNNDLEKLINRLYNVIMAYIEIIGEKQWTITN